MPGLFHKIYSWLFKTDQPARRELEPPAAPQKHEVGPSTPAADKVEPSAPVTPEAPVEPVIKAPPSEAIVDLHIGLDLGTSCSKIVIGDAFLDDCHGVDFNGADRGVNNYLFPTRFFETPSQASLTRLPAATTRFDLKLRLMNAVSQGADTAEPETDLAIYLALLLKHSFDWFSQHAAANHRNRECCWWLNVGFPAKRIEGNPRLADSYTRACIAATRAVDSGEPICRRLLQRCMSAPSSPDCPSRVTPERIHLYPEIAAQLAGYAYSPYRKDGPLLLLDIGAGTLDVSTLILHPRDGEEIVSFHFCEVVPLGAFHLYQETHQAMSSLAPAAMRPLIASGDDPAWRPPASVHEFLVSRDLRSSELESAFDTARASFAGRCLDTCQANFSRFKVYLDAPFLREHLRPPAFRKRVNFILSGGGSRAQFYRNLYPDHLEERILNLTSWHLDRATRRNHEQGLQRIYFTQPETFRAAGIQASDFDRLSVAHGLSMGVETLMKITAKAMSDRQ